MKHLFPVGNQFAFKHGYRKRVHSLTYNSWRNMIARCYNESYPRYDCYGGRGIVVCDRWKKFENFLADMGERPDKEHTIDRGDVNGNYCKENCKWATRKEQEINKRIKEDVGF